MNNRAFCVSLAAAAIVAVLLLLPKPIPPVPSGMCKVIGEIRHASDGGTYVCAVTIDFSPKGSAR